MSKPRFTHLHVHSHYSLLDGLPKIPDLVARAKELGMDSIALTDHGVLYGAVEFYKHGRKEGVKAIIGQEMYITPGSMHEKRSRVDDIRYHLTVLVKNETGYRNLVELTTRAHLEGYYYRPRVDKDLLRKHAEGLLCLSGCLNSELARTIRSGDMKKAKKVVFEYQEIFGPENYFLEVWHHPNVEGSLETMKKIVALGRELKIPLVATHDVHYLHPEDAEAQDILVAVQTGKSLEDGERMSMRGEDFSLKSPEEMAAKFADLPEAIENTQQVAALCSFEFTLGEIQLPRYPVPGGQDAIDYLYALARQGAQEIYGSPLPRAASARLEYELGVIKKTGFAEYFLIVADFVRWAKARGIMVGPGRGSVAGSLVAYGLGITHIDPLKYDLIFERFLNPDRIALPDIDLDFADTRRDEVIGYVREKYGNDHVAQIITFGTMAARAAVRDAGRALGMSYGFCDLVAKTIPFGFTLGRALERTAELKQLYETDPEAKRLLDAAGRLEGVARHASTHAAGVVITRDPLTGSIPLQHGTRDDDTIVTQYEMHAIEDLGLLKMDFLGLKNLTIIEETLVEIERNHGVKVDLDTIRLDDPQTFALLQQARTSGVFQLESGGMKRFLKELKPTEFEDIIAMVSLYRPGPMELLPAYIRRKHGREPINYIHPKLEPILHKTYGVGVYQEQMMQIARDLAGFTLAEADTLRKAIGKKIKRLLDEQEEKLVEGMVKNGIDRRTAEQIWALFPPFARYGFNRSHAACYATIAYQTAYLKAHYPVEFMNALLNADSGDVERIAFLTEEAKEFGISVLAPDVNESGVGFRVTTPTTIRFGIAAIKNVGEGVARSIVEEREVNGPFSTIENFLTRLPLKDLNKKSLESLIKAGVFDNLGERGRLLVNIEGLLGFAKESRVAKEAGQESIFETGGAQTARPAIRLKAAETATKREKLSWEKELLGLYISDHPLSEFSAALAKNARKIQELKPSRAPVAVGGILTSLKKIVTKNGQPMVFAELQDLSGTIELVVFPSILQKNATLWREENVLLVKGRVQERDNELKFICEDAQLLA